MILTELAAVIWAVAIGFRSTDAINFCDSSSDSDPRSQHIAAKSTAIDGKCYFVIKPESIEPFNLCHWKWHFDYSFDLELVELGRKVCNNFEATLPMIKTKEENNAVRTLASGQWVKANVPLGMKCWGEPESQLYSVHWDDGSSNLFEHPRITLPPPRGAPTPPSREHCRQYGKPFASFHANNKGFTFLNTDGSWVSYDHTPHVIASIRLTLLLCQQNLGTAVVIKEKMDLPVLQPPLPNPPPDGSSDFCDLSEHDPRRNDILAAFHSYSGGRLEKCFFSFKVYRPFVTVCGGNETFQLDMDEPTNICKAYSGTLPMIKNLDQWNTLGAFAPFGLRKDPTNHIHFLLGVEKHSYAEKKIVWNDGSVYKFDTDHPFHGKVQWVNQTAGPLLAMRLEGGSLLGNPLQMQSQGRVLSWTTFELICEQDLSLRAASAPTHPSPLPDSDFCAAAIPWTDKATDFCDPAKAKVDPRNGFIQNRLYYPDPMKGSTEDSKKCFFTFAIWYMGKCPFNEGLAFKIDMKATREICKKFSATLPMIREHQEQRFLIALGKTKAGLLDNFYIPLGVQKWERDSTSGTTKIFWDDGTTHNFTTDNPFENQTPWHRSDKEEDRIAAMLDANGRWLSESSAMQNVSIVIMCEQDLGKPLMTLPPTPPPPMSSPPSPSPTATSPPSDSAIGIFKSYRYWLMAITSSMIILGQI